MKRWKLYVLLVLMVVLVLGACNDNDLEDYEDELLENGENELNEEVSNPVLEEEAGELILRHTFIDDDSDPFIGMIESIEEKSGLSIALDPQGYEGFEAILTDEISRQELPHIIEIFGFLHSFIHEESDSLLDLTDFLEEKDMLGQFHSLDSFTVDGRVYGLPFRGFTTHLYYNKELLESLGGVPETLEELVDRMEEANQAGYTPIVLDEYGTDLLILFEGMLQQSGSTANLYDLINGSANWTDDQFVHTFELVERIGHLDIPVIETEMIGNPLELAEAFLTEDIVFFYNGDYLPTIQSQDEFVHTIGNIGVMPLPPMSTAQGDQYSIHGNFNDGFVFSADLSEKEEQMIYQFIETLWSDEFMTDYNIAYGHAPAMNVESATNDDLFMEIVEINNQATGIFAQVRSMDSFRYQEEIVNVLTELMDGNLSTFEAAEALQEYHETSADNVL